MNQIVLTKESEEYLEDLADELSVPPSRYEEAERSYKSLGTWLEREGSSVKAYDPHVYVQGSFRLGTTIRPANDLEEYDVDSVCEFRRLGKSQLTQSKLKIMLGTEIELYRRSKQMTKPMREGRRCWILDYADGAQFHMDIVPALPNGQTVRKLLETNHMDARFSGTAVSITDNENHNYHAISEDWPRSNPKGYGEWFKTRMAVILERRKRALAEGTYAKVEDIPDYKVKTPLQAAIMILKRHRDHSFAARPDDRPISIIITTLAAHAYNGEDTIGQALVSILEGMDRYILQRNGQYWIPNPTDPLENFADKWAKHPQRAQAFFQWLNQARIDFSEAARQSNRQAITETVGRGVGKSLAGRAAGRRQPVRSPLLKTPTAAPAGLSFPSTGRVPTKPQGFG